MIVKCYSIFYKRSGNDNDRGNDDGNVDRMVIVNDYDKNGCNGDADNNSDSENDDDSNSYRGILMVAAIATTIKI